MNDNNMSSLRQNVEFQHDYQEKHQDTLTWGQNWRWAGMNIMKQWFRPIFAPSPNDCDPWPSRQLSPQSSSAINQTAITWWPTQTYWESDCYCHHTQPSFDIQFWILFWVIFDILSTFNLCSGMEGGSLWCGEQALKSAPQLIQMKIRLTP